MKRRYASLTAKELQNLLLTTINHLTSLILFNEWNCNLFLDDREALSIFLISEYKNIDLYIIISMYLMTFKDISKPLSLHTFVIRLILIIIKINNQK